MGSLILITMHTHCLPGATAQRVGGGSGNILLSNVKCSGDEAHLLSCIQSSLGTINHCNHDNDAGVICSEGNSTIYT